MTPQRIAIVRLFANNHSHPTVAELHTELTEKHPELGISVATVYNTLSQLKELQLCREIVVTNEATNTGTLPVRFDPNVTKHDHTVCERCGAVRDIVFSRQPVKVIAASKEMEVSGFTVTSIETLYRGLCHACSQG